MGQWMSPSDVGSRWQVGASMLEQKVTKLTKGESWGPRRRRINAGKVGAVRLPRLLFPGERLLKTADALRVL